MHPTQQAVSIHAVRTCTWCGKELTGKQQRFCSRACSAASSKRLEKRTCQECGMEFQRRPSDMTSGSHKGAFCSPACARKSQIGKKLPQLQIQPLEYVCPACGNTFLVGGRGRPPKDQVFCSDECKERGRYRRGALSKDLAVPDAAYIAGFVDGEGSIILHGRMNSIAVRLSIANTNRAILEWISEVTGLGCISMHRSETATHKTAWEWLTNGDGAASIISQLRPHLHIKAAQADLALETMARLRDPVFKADRTWQAEYRNRMHAMNARGPQAA